MVISGGAVGVREVDAGMPAYLYETTLSSFRVGAAGHGEHCRKHGQADT
jgi:hypothetical protein